ncbi:MAG: bifunctional response regulator/alkaline phosphatase family protein [Cytophagaceae bacterium]|jgi:CheY-like chemotaxis protein|nr:bifunctional response regulator/alkaline phosphatase family protein [Cytophagaceae bacterium]
MNRYSILWADDEIDLLKPYILFLTSKGYDVTPVVSGPDAIEKCQQSNFDLLFLDENMPGMSGLTTLSKIKVIRPALPVVMITKSEEEHIMEEAIGSRITDYLIKPINPNQVLLTVKKILDNKRLIEEKTNSGYQQDFRELSMSFSDKLDWQEWIDIYRKLVFWELEIDRTENKSMGELIDQQKQEANSYFSRFIQKNYDDWMNIPTANRPLMSHQLMRKKVFPHLEKEEMLFVIVMDNLRYDQWKILQPAIEEYYYVQEEDLYFSILPTTTSYARNSIFSGLLPDDMSKRHPEWWAGEGEEEGKNEHEQDFLGAQLTRHRVEAKFSYHKIITQDQGRQVLAQLNNLYKNKLNVLVYNFVDMLSHARTDMAMIRELAPDESAYRSLTQSWFQHSSLLEVLKKLSEKKCKVIITTDHGTIRVKKPFKIIGDREVTTNLRYKEGKNLNYEDKDVLSCRKPERFHLPKRHLSSSFVFAQEDYFFAYPNNFNYYVNYYRDTFQHGGISLEEMIIPVIELLPRNSR